MDEHWKRVLAGTFIPRPISVSTVAKYITELRNGSWRLAPAPICFDTNGNLIQGQHRLEAVRRSGVTAEFFLSKGWSPDIMEVLDTGKARTVGTMMIMSGMKNTTALARSLGCIARIAFRANPSGLTFTQAKALLAYQNMGHSIEEVLRKATGTKDHIGYIVGSLAYYHSVQPKKALAFAGSLFNFETSEGSPVRLFLNWQKTAQETTMATKIRVMAYCLRAWDEDTQPQKTSSHPDHVRWLADINPKLRDWIRQHISRAGRGLSEQAISAAGSYPPLA